MDERPGVGPERPGPGCREPCPAGGDFEVEGSTGAGSAVEAVFPAGVLFALVSPVLGDV
ncbi:hypothetical protein [Sorangium sp. So ce381]|uniref:hypothetical protein n=1 Tax=Sorangium sp. So ce381 TaxID=3133307 RepID=UPI003F5B598C